MRAGLLLVYLKKRNQLSEESKILFNHVLVYGDSGIEGRGCDIEVTDITETL